MVSYRFKWYEIYTKDRYSWVGNFGENYELLLRDFENNYFPYTMGMEIGVSSEKIIDILEILSTGIAVCL